MQKPKHKESTNYEHCCSCCSVLEKELNVLKTYIAVTLNKSIDDVNKIASDMLK